MYFALFLLLSCITFIYLVRDRRRPITSQNYLSTMYDIYNKNIFAFHTKISGEEKKYISTIISNFDCNKEFEKSVDISPYSFSISIHKESNKVNLTRVNIGSVENDITPDVTRLLQYFKINGSICDPDYKYYGVGWDLIDRIIKFYTLSKDKTKIRCHVYKVQRNQQNEVTQAIFHTKKEYEVGKKNTIMHKDGRKIDQINLSRIKAPPDIKHTIGNEWIERMTNLDFILDTYSDYDGNINLYFD
jgi:hypothetical protein